MTTFTIVEFDNKGEELEAKQSGLLTRLQSLPNVVIVTKNSMLETWLQHYLDGWSLRRIGKAYGLSHQRIHQVLSKDSRYQMAVQP